MLHKDQTFKTQLNSNGDMEFKVTLNSQNQSVPIQFQKNKTEIDTSTQFNSNVVESSGQVNNSPEDGYYDEVIFYDGGGVEGYGY